MTPHIPITGRAAERRRRQVRIKSLMFGIAVAAVGFGALRLPGVGPWLIGGLAAVLVVVAGFAGLVALGWLGFGLFALFDRVVAWVGRRASWPDEP